jgi:hypothetical protein
MVSGQVRGLQQRTESYSEHGRKSVLVFRLERYDTAGNRLRPIPVQMRAIGFDGWLSDGDEVQVTGRWKDGTLHGSRADNLTSGAAVTSQSWKKRALLAAVAIVVMATVFGVLAMHLSHSFNDEQNRNHQLYCEQVQSKGLTVPGC